MMGSFLTRGLILALGYAYPAYECFKVVERNKPEIEQLRFWCQYWILVVALTMFERVGDTFISWLPMYSEAKLAFFIYLWYPKTRGTTYVYETFLRPYVAKHETDIDRSLLELRTRAGDAAVLYGQRIASYGQTRIFEILQFVASQSQSPRPRPAQPPQSSQRARQPPPIVPTRQTSSVSQQPARQPTAASPTRQPAAASPARQPATASPTRQTAAASPTRQSSTALQTQQQAQQPSIRRTHTSVKSQASEAPSDPAEAAPGAPSSLIQTAQSAPAEFSAEVAAPSKPSEEVVAAAPEVASTVATEESNPAPNETVMEEAIRVTRGRLRKSRTAPATTTK